MCGGGTGFGGVAGEIEERLAQEAFVAGDVFERAFAANPDCGDGFRDFGDDAIDQRLHRDLFVGDVERARIFREIR